MRLTTRTKSGSIDEVLDSLLEKQRAGKHHIEELKKEVHRLTEDANLYIQKIGFLRFNPFSRVGGEQSFIVALLDKGDTGVILNFLYTRDGVRIYAKRVKGGKAEEYELSDEEKEAIKKAT